MYRNGKLKLAAIALAAGLAATGALAHEQQPPSGMMQGDMMPMMGMMGMMGEMQKMMENCNRMMQASLEKRDSPPAPAQPEKQQQ
jgi:hypothetical protein